MIKPATQADIDHVQANSLENTKDYPAVAVREGVVALWNNGQLYGVGGVLILRPGVGEFWLLLAKDYKDHISVRDAVVEIADQINVHSAKHALVRCQAIVRADFAEGLRLIEWLGFEYEGYLRMYLPGEVDAVMYARIEI